MSTNFKLGTRVEYDNPHHWHARWPQGSKVKITRPLPSGCSYHHLQGAGAYYDGRTGCTAFSTRSMRLLFVIIFTWSDRIGYQRLDSAGHWRWSHGGETGGRSRYKIWSAWNSNIDVPSPEFLLLISMQGCISWGVTGSTPDPLKICRRGHSMPRAT